MTDVVEVEEEVVVDRSTPLVCIATGEYPLYLRDLTVRVGNISFGSTVNASVLEELGYAPVVAVPPPQGDVVNEVTPVAVDGVYKQTYSVREFTEEEKADRLTKAKERILLDIEAWRVKQFEKGFPHRFGENVYHIQVRTVDRGNISDCRIIAKEALAEGGSPTFNFRTFENVTVTLNAEEMVALANETLAQVQAGYMLSWNLKDQVSEATSVEDFPEIPVEMFSLQ